MRSVRLLVVRRGRRRRAVVVVIRRGRRRRVVVVRVRGVLLLAHRLRLFLRLFLDGVEFCLLLGLLRRPGILLALLLRLGLVLAPLLALCLRGLGLLVAFAQ